jgi:hypothetical protein
MPYVSYILTFYDNYAEHDRGNLILADCKEDRVINSRDYVRPLEAPTAEGAAGDGSTTTTTTTSTTPAKNERRVVTRTLQQAMIPGPELVRVQVIGQAARTRIE